MKQITIVKMTSEEYQKYVNEDAWDFPLSEIEYLLETHSGETFALVDNRLWEVSLE